MFQGCLPPILSEKKSDAVSHNLQTTAVSHSPVLALQTVPAQDPAHAILFLNKKDVLSPLQEQGDHLRLEAHEDQENKFLLLQFLHQAQNAVISVQSLSCCLHTKKLLHQDNFSEVQESNAESDRFLL